MNVGFLFEFTNAPSTSSCREWCKWYKWYKWWVWRTTGTIFATYDHTFGHQSDNPLDCCSIRRFLLLHGHFVFVFRISKRNHRNQYFRIVLVSWQCHPWHSIVSVFFSLLFDSSLRHLSKRTISKSLCFFWNIITSSWNLLDRLGVHCLFYRQSTSLYYT